MTAVIHSAPVHSAPVSPSVRPRRTVRSTRLPWAWIRAVGGAGVLAVLVWQVGTGPFLDGVRVIDATALPGCASVDAHRTLRLLESQVVPDVHVLRKGKQPGGMSTPCKPGH